MQLTQTLNSLGTDNSQWRIYFENIKSFPLGELRKSFLSTSSPQGWSWDISAHLLKFQFACAVFRSNLVLFLLQSDGKVLFILLPFGFLFFLCGQIYIVWFIKCRNVDLIKWRNLVFNQMQIFCYQQCLNRNHHLTNNSRRRRSQQLKMVIRCLVKQ